MYVYMIFITPMIFSGMDIGYHVILLIFLKHLLHYKAKILRWYNHSIRLVITQIQTRATAITVLQLTITMHYTRKNAGLSLNHALRQKRNEPNQLMCGLTCAGLF